MKNACLIITVLCVGYAAAAQPHTGFAMSVSYRWGSKDWQPLIPEADNEAMKGRICRFTIENARTVRCDTVFYGMGQYPAISWDGSRVAFFRLGIYRTNKGNTLEGWTNPVRSLITVGQTGDSLYGSWNDAWISVIDRDGSIRNLVKLPVRPGVENGLDWPVGDWIYYVCPNASMSREGNEVRRVNVLTSQDEHVASFSGLWMRRFTMTLDGASFASQTMGGGGSNTLFRLPALLSIESLPACNISVSPSGDALANYLGGNHKEVWNIDPRKPSLWDAANWNPDLCFTTADADGSLGCEVIRWSVNSDRWFSQNVGWYGHAGNLIRGGNALLMNWIEHKALCVSSNPKVPATNADAAVLYVGNCVGDFFLDGPLGKYQGLDDLWHAMPGAVLPIALSADTVRFSANAGSANPASQSVNATFSAGNTPMTLAVSDDSPWLSVSVEGTGSGQSIRVSADISGLSSGNYAGHVTVTAGTLKTGFAVAMRVGGTAAPSMLELTNDTLYIQAQGTAQFSAALRDQFGQTVAGTITWNVTGGGTMSTSGLFTSNGTIGTYGVTGQSGSVSSRGAIIVTANKPLPTEGYLKEFLCLETSAGSLYLPKAEADAIQTALNGSGRRIPVDGQQVTVGAATYTWRLRSDADGVWANDDSKEGVVSYFYTNLVTQSSRRVQIVCKYDDEFTAWLDGNRLTYRPWATAGLEDWNAQFILPTGSTGLLLKLYEDYGGNYLGIRIVDPLTEKNAVGVQYYPPGAASIVTATEHGAIQHAKTLTVVRNALRILPQFASDYRVSIVAANGAAVRSLSGHGPKTMPLGGLAAGVYMVRFTEGNASVVARVLVK